MATVSAQMFYRVHGGGHEQVAGSGALVGIDEPTTSRAIRAYRDALRATRPKDP